jgi:phosphopantothenoylcysteine decarboxylase / phosphopantothenate---cysteine ligase
MARLANKRIILGVAGGIAAYKSCELASRLRQEGALVTAVLTPGACKFVTPLCFEALTGRPCLTRMFRRVHAGESPYPHIDPAREAELVILAPATAGLMARLAHGLASELLSTLMLNVRCPILACPAMNVRMWEHPLTQVNVKILERAGYTFLGPSFGALACGMEGVGRMAELAEIFESACKLLKNQPPKAPGK